MSTFLLRAHHLPQIDSVIQDGVRRALTTIESLAPKIGCVPQTLNEWVKRDEIDNGTRAGVTTTELQRLKELERENKELRKANEILKLASAFFAQAELDRRLKS